MKLTKHEIVFSTGGLTITLFNYMFTFFAKKLTEIEFKKLVDKYGRNK